MRCTFALGQGPSEALGRVPLPAEQLPRLAQTWQAPSCRAAAGKEERTGDRRAPRC